MQIRTFLVKYAEIGTKGKNRYKFEDILCKRIRSRLKPLGQFEVRRDYGRIFVDAKSDYDYDEAVKRIAEFPYACGLYRTDRPMRDEIRMAPVKNYLLYYAVFPDRVEIRRFLHSRRDRSGEMDK